MIKRYPLNLDISSRSLNDMFEVNSNDLNTISLEIKIKDGLYPFDLTGKIVRLAVKKPDDTLVFQTGGITDAKNGVCEVILSRQAYLVDGKHEAELMVYEGVETVAVTTLFYYKVRKAILNDETLESTNEFPAIHAAIKAAADLEGKDLVELIESAETAIVAADNADIKANYAKAQGDYAKAKADITAQRITELNGVDAVQFKDRQDQFGAQLADTATKVSTVSPEDFGAKGDGITDDYAAIKQCMLSGATNIIFGLNKTYVVSTFGFLSEKKGLTINGNGSTIKLMDNSGLLNRVRDNKEGYYENYCFYLGGDNSTVKNLTINGNADNNFFIHNEEKYYGYQKDIAIPGLPNKYITTFGIEVYGNNFSLDNCTFKDIGGAFVFMGKTFLADNTVDNCTVTNCTFEDGFRDQAVFTQSRNVNVSKCNFINNQRKAIQFYLDDKFMNVEDCYFSIDVSKIRKWYPTWSIDQPDAELVGIGIKNPNYPDDKYLVENITIKNNKFHNFSNALLIRDYSRNIEISKNNFANCFTVVQATSGIDGVVDFANNVLENCQNGFLLTLNKSELVPLSKTRGIAATLNITNNQSSVKGVLLNLDPKGVLDLYKNLTIRVLHNVCADASNPIRYSTTYNNLPYLTLIQNDNKNGIRDVQIKRYGVLYKVPEFENFTFKTESIGAKTATGYDYVKLFTLNSSIASSSCFLSGNIYNTSGSNINYCDFYVSIRIHYNGLTNNSIIQAGIKNVIGVRAANSIQLVDRLEGGERVIDVYGYVHNDSGQSVFEFKNSNGITENFTFIPPDSNKWGNSLSSGVVVSSTVLS